MALVNALLVQWSGGTLWVEDAGSIGARGRREGYVQLGQAASEAEASRMAQAVLAQRLGPAVEYNAEVEPAGGDVPYVDFGLGDTISVPNEQMTPAALEVREFTVTTDDDGEPIYAVAFETVHAVEEARIQRWLKRMAHGSLAGTVHSASPLPLPSPPPRPGAYRLLAPFSWSGAPAAPTDSHDQHPMIVTRLVGVDVVVTGNATGTEHVTGTVLIRRADLSVSGGIAFDLAVGVRGAQVFVPGGMTAAPTIDGPSGDTLFLHLATTGTATGVTVTPIIG